MTLAKNLLRSQTIAEKFEGTLLEGIPELSYGRGGMLQPHKYVLTLNRQVDFHEAGATEDILSGSLELQAWNNRARQDRLFTVTLTFPFAQRGLHLSAEGYGGVGKLSATPVAIIEAIQLATGVDFRNLFLKEEN